LQGLVRSLLATFLVLPISFGWALPVGAAPITATVCLRDSQGLGISGAEAFVRSGSFVSLGLTDLTGCVSTDLSSALGNRTFRITHRGFTVNKAQDTSIDPNVIFQTVAVNVRLLDSTGSGIPGAAVEFHNGAWQSLGNTDATGTVTTELLGRNTNFRITHLGRTQNKAQNTATNPDVLYQTGRVLQGTGPRILAWFASGWRPFTNGVELLPGNVTFDFNTGPNRAHAVVAGTTIYVPVAPTAPEVNAADQSANEGEPMALASVSFTDLEAVQTHRATIDWGDGSPLTTGLVVQADGLAGSVAGSHVFADDGTYIVEVCVSDDGDPDAEGCETLRLTVANLAPVVTILDADSGGVEGAELILSSEVADADQVTLSWTISLGGTTIATGTDPDLAFTPADDGVYDVALTADDGEGGITTVTSQVAVVNVGPSVTITGAPAPVVEDDVVTLGSDATDPGPTDVLTYAWTVTRDGAPLASGSGPDFSFTPDAAGSYEVTLVVGDGDGATATAQVLIEVTAAPQAESEPAPKPAPEPEEGPAAENETTDHNRTSDTREWSNPAPVFASGQALSDEPASATEPESPTAPESEPVSDGVGPTTPPDQVMLQALLAKRTANPSSNLPSIGLILGLLWLGPTLVILARTQLRRGTD